MPEWISAVAESITALSVILLFFQLKAAKDQIEEAHNQLSVTHKQLETAHRQLKDDHERSRRESAIHNLLIWTKSLDPETSSARKLVETFSAGQCQSLEAGQQLRIDSQHIALITGCFPGIEFDPAASGEIGLTPGQSTRLRYIMVRYVNTLETILASWRHNVADKGIIREEFGYLLAPEKGHYLLRNFRTVLGNHNYPAIQDFEQDLIQNKLPQKGGPPLG